LLAAFYLADLACAVLAMAWGIPYPLASNWVFLSSLAVSHFVLSICCTRGISDGGGATVAVAISAALAYVLFCAVSIDIEFLLRSSEPLASLELGALAGSMVHVLLRPRRSVGQAGSSSTASPGPSPEGGS